MDEFMDGLKNIKDMAGTLYLTDGCGEWVKYGDDLMDKMLLGEDDGMDKKKEEMLIEIQEKLEVMSNAISDVQYLVDEELRGDEEDRNIDLKVIIKLNRLEDELEACYDMFIEGNL